MKEQQQESSPEYRVDQKLAILEHRNCASTVGTVVAVAPATGIPTIRCDACPKLVIEDRRNPLPKKSRSVSYDD